MNKSKNTKRDRITGIEGRPRVWKSITLEPRAPSQDDLALGDPRNELEEGNRLEQRNIYHQHLESCANFDPRAAEREGSECKLPARMKSVKQHAKNQPPSDVLGQLERLSRPIEQKRDCAQVANRRSPTKWKSDKIAGSPGHPSCVPAQRRYTWSRRLGWVGATSDRSLTRP
ncbi:hypothetical protein R1flu_005091 [Riccia fluitans]|uniref:Uncharacterized protein n=1 Tax=Riccia fluitans TaxID=41844 RepID=A0ABD1YV64_9MARC